MLDLNLLSRLAVWAFACLAGAVLPGCMAGYNAPTDISLDQLRGRGLVIVSYSASGSYGNGYFAKGWPALVWRAVSPGPKQDHISCRGWISPCPDKSAAGNPNDKPFGRVSALVLMPGEYEFCLWEDWDFHGEFGGVLSNPIRFSVTSGTATYIGHIQLTLENGKGYQVATGDRRIMDLPVFHTTYAQIKPEQVRFAIMSATTEAQAADKH